MKIHLASLLLVGALLPGCDDGVLTIPAGKGHIKFINAVANAPSLRIDIEGETRLKSFALDSGSSYLQIGSGRPQNINVFASDTARSSTFQSYSLAPESYVTVVMTGKAPQPTLFPLGIDTLTPPAAGKARLRFVHVSENSDIADIYLNGSKLTETPYDLFEFSQFFTVDQGAAILELRETGTENLIGRINITLGDQKLYTVVLRDVSGDPENNSAINIVEHKR